MAEKPAQSRRLQHPRIFEGVTLQKVTQAEPGHSIPNCSGCISAWFQAFQKDFDSSMSKLSKTDSFGQSKVCHSHFMATVLELETYNAECLDGGHRVSHLAYSNI